MHECCMLHHLSHFADITREILQNIYKMSLMLYNGKIYQNIIFLLQNIAFLKQSIEQSIDESLIENRNENVNERTFSKKVLQNVKMRPSAKRKRAQRNNLIYLDMQPFQ